MEKSFTNRNSKKAVLITDEGLLTSGIVKALDELDYKTTVKKLDKLEKRDYKTRLIIIVSHIISEIEMKLCKDIRENSIYANIVLVTGVDKNKISNSILKIGIDAVVSGFDTIENFKSAVEAVENEKTFISPFFIDEETVDEEKLNRLTKRQYQIYLLNKEGKSQEEIGKVLNITPKTVSNHISKIRNILA